EKLNVEIEVLRFFDEPTIADLAHQIERLTNGGQARRLSLSIPRAPRTGRRSASIAQARLCELQNALPDLPFLNILYALSLTSPVDVGVLERSINEIVRRHEILRTTFPTKSNRRMQVVARHLTVPLRFKDLRGPPKSKMQTVAHRLIEEEALYSFDLA